MMSLLRSNQPWCRLVTVAATALSLLAGGVVAAPSAGAVTMISGVCVLDLSASLSGGSLSLDSIPGGSCQTTQLTGVPIFDATIPGSVLAFDCQKGVGHDQAATFEVIIDDLTFRFSNVTVAAVWADGVLHLDLLKADGPILVGTGVFVQPGSVGDCSTSFSLTGSIAFSDPWLE